MVGQRVGERIGEALGIPIFAGVDAVRETSVKGVFQIFVNNRSNRQIFITSAGEIVSPDSFNNIIGA